MCRIAGYLGPSRPLADLLFSPPHGLSDQAYRPRELVHGHVNVDGTGVAWWPEGADGPLRYVTAATPWADPNLRDLAARLTGTMILGAVRSATPGVGFGTDHVAPFVLDGVAVAHNGWFQGLAGPVGRALVADLDDDLLGHLRVWNDSRLLFLTVVAGLRDGLELPKAMARAVTRIADLCARHDLVCSLTVVAGDGRRFVATRAALGERANSLYTRVAADATWVASEPLDDRDWSPVPPGSLVVVTADGTDVEPLDGLEGTAS